MGLCRHNTALEHLDLRFNYLGRGGSVPLSAGLASNATLTWLDLRGTSLPPRQPVLG